MASIILAKKRPVKTPKTPLFDASLGDRLKSDFICSGRRRPDCPAKEHTQKAFARFVA
jgi:hypothetical protein